MQPMFTSSLSLKYKKLTRLEFSSGPKWLIGSAIHVVKTWSKSCIRTLRFVFSFLHCYLQRKIRWLKRDLNSHLRVSRPPLYPLSYRINGDWWRVLSNLIDEISIAQWAERRSRNPKVRVQIPLEPTNFSLVVAV